MSDPVIPDPDAWVDLESSNIARVQWVYTGDIPSFPDGIFTEKVGDLWVEFTSGGKGAYREVPQAPYQLLLQAESPGRFLNSQIKPNYLYTKVR